MANVVFNVQAVVTRPVVEPPPAQPILIMPPGKVVRSAADQECNDPRHGQTKGYVPRTYQQAVAELPQTFKLESGGSLVMTLPWATLWHDAGAHYAPKDLLTAPPFDLDKEEWAFLNGFVPANAYDQWWIHRIHGARDLTNKTGPNDPGFFDPYTGYGTPGADGTMQPFRKEEVNLAVNYYWSISGGRNVWCLDGLAEAPLAKDLIAKAAFFLLHISVQCSNVIHDATKRPEIDCPNGIFRQIGYPQAGGNISVYPLTSNWEKGRTLEWNGFHLRESIIQLERFKPDFPPPAPIPWPFTPEKDLIVNW